MDPTKPPVDLQDLWLRLLSQRCQEYALVVLPTPGMAHAIGRAVPTIGPFVLLYAHWYGSLVTGLRANARDLKRDAMRLNRSIDQVFGPDDSHRDH